MTYNFKQELNTIAETLEARGYAFNDLFTCNGGHPPLLRLYIRKQISLETLIILDMVLKFMLPWDKQMDDPLWSALSLKIKKYKPFLSIPVSKYKELIKQEFVK